VVEVIFKGNRKRISPEAVMSVLFANAKQMAETHLGVIPLPSLLSLFLLIFLLPSATPSCMPPQWPDYSVFAWSLTRPVLLSLTASAHPPPLLSLARKELSSSILEVDPALLHLRSSTMVL
jgi:hypothetical protein